MGFVQPTKGMSLVGSLLAALIDQSPAAAVASHTATREAVLATEATIGVRGGGSPGVFPDADWARYAETIQTQGRRVPAVLVELVTAGARTQLLKKRFILKKNCWCASHIQPKP